MFQRDPKSHKGQNGRVAVIGGSHRYHGAPIFSALAAEASGVDLIYPVIHACHEGVARMASFNFIVHTFKENSLQKGDTQRILSLLEHTDACIIGPGMAETPENVAAISVIAASTSCPLILDATAIHPGVLHSLPDHATALLTPHRGELGRLVGKDLGGLSPKDLTALVRLIAEEHGVTVLLKGPEDIIVDPAGKTSIVKGGNAGLTKGGTGDALAGLTAGLIAQKISPFDACTLAATIIKKAGEKLFKTKEYAYTTCEVIGLIPDLLTGQT